MKNLIWMLIKTLVVVVSLTANYRGLLSDGVINLVLLWAWIEIALICFGSLAIFDEKELEKLAKKLGKKSQVKWRMRLSRMLMVSIGLSFIFWDYWVTGIAWLISVVLLSVVGAVVKNHLEQKAES